MKTFIPSNFLHCDGCKDMKLEFFLKTIPYQVHVGNLAIVNISQKFGMEPDHLLILINYNKEGYTNGN